MDYTDEQILANRLKWIDYLESDEAKKRKGMLDGGNNERCCLGHGCYALGFVGVPHPLSLVISYDGESGTAPHRLQKMVGLNGPTGYIGLHGAATSLVSMNDHTEATPQTIGAYLRTVVYGGANTPFKQIAGGPDA